MPEISIEAQITCVKRELRFRERSYPRWVSEGKMTQQQADHELAHMKAVLATLEKIQAVKTPELAL
jgi:hypothetical protein